MSGHSEIRLPPRPGEQEHRPRDRGKYYLTIPVTQERFDQLVDGTVTTDYLPFTPRWQKRLLDNKDLKAVSYVCGPSTAAFELLRVDVASSIVTDRKAVIGVRFALRLGKRLFVEDEGRQSPQEITKKIVTTVLKNYPSVDIVCGAGVYEDWKKPGRKKKSSRRSSRTTKNSVS